VNNLFSSPLVWRTTMHKFYFAGVIQWGYFSPPLCVVILQ